jgi:hypothetical protein
VRPDAQKACLPKSVEARAAVLLPRLPRPDNHTHLCPDQTQGDVSQAPWERPLCTVRKLRHRFLCILDTRRETLDPGGQIVHRPAVGGDALHGDRLDRRDGGVGRVGQRRHGGVDAGKGQDGLQALARVLDCLSGCVPAVRGRATIGGAMLVN